MNHLKIDLDKCIGCGKCARICMKDNIVIQNKKATETGNGCLECSHCVSTCPKGAIELIQSDEKKGAFSEIKKDKMFDGGMVSENDLQELYKAMNKGHAENGCEFITLQGDNLNRFMETVWDIVNEKESDTPLVKEWAKWRMEHDKSRPNPVLWEGNQVLFIFADSPDIAFSASNRMMVKGLDLRIRGFHSNIIMTAYKLEPQKIMAYFPYATKHLYMSYVIGHPRRMVEPVFKPMKEVKKLFDRL